MVVARLAEVYRSSKAVNWEQDYAVTLTRGLFGGWWVSGVRTKAVAVVQAFGSYAQSGQTQIVVPPMVGAVGR